MLLILATALLGGAVIYFILLPKIKESQMQRKLAKWNSSPKDVVIMHAIRRGRTVSHPSPFVVKLETYLRMAKIPYETDLGLSDAWGPKGRFPWISLNGEHMGDSQLIMEFLKKRFNVKLGAEYSKEAAAVGGAVRVMMDDHFFWGLVLYRFVYGSFANLRKVMGSFVPSWRVRLFRFYAGHAFATRSKGHGIGLHSREEIEKLTLADLHVLSDILGDKAYLLGSQPSEWDATVFGHLSQAMWGLPGSIYEAALQKDLVNLKEYCIRMKTTFYPDWDTLLEK